MVRGPPERRAKDGFLETTVTWTLSVLPDGATLLRLDHDGFTVAQERTYNILKSGWTGEKMRNSIERVVAGLK